MGGWTIFYNFNISGFSFTAIDWHEIEFARNKIYAAANGGSSVSHNGAASIWINPRPEYSVGAQWRYAVDKLGTAGALNALILSLKYNF